MSLEPLKGWTIYVHDDEEYVSIHHETMGGDTLLRMPAGWRDKARVLAFVNAVREALGLEKDEDD